jgi:cardiolipin synthase
MTMMSHTIAKTFDRTDHRVGPTWVPRRARVAPKQKSGDAGVLQCGPGGDAARLVTATIDGARSMVAVCTFLLADRGVTVALRAASERGVRIYLLLAAEDRLLNSPPEDDTTSRAAWERDVKEQFKAMLGALAGRVMIRTADHFHAKVVLADPFTDPRGVLLTANLGDRGLTRNEELVVALTADETTEAARLVRWALWEEAGHEAIAEGPLRHVTPLGQVPHPDSPSSVLSTTRQCATLRARVLDMIEGEHGTIIACNYGWDAEHPVVRALQDKAQRGVQVQVLARVRAAAMPALVSLAQAGASVLAFDHLHAKALWTPTHGALVMSANFEADGMDTGFEMGVPLGGPRADAVRSVLDQWSASAPWLLATEPRLGDLSGEIQVWDSARLERVSVREEVEHHPPAITAPSADALEMVEIGVPTLAGADRFARRVRVVQEVRPPLLQRAAVEVLREVPAADGKPKRVPYSPRVYQERDGRRVVVIAGQEELTAAIELKATLAAAAIVLREGRA